MCGIAGTFGFGDEELVQIMTDTLAHRGPDDRGFHVGEQVCLGNRRLAILDVADGGQPMASEDGSVVVVYNGEIYNYPELRQQVLGRGHALRTHCDTELLPHLYEDEGIEFAKRLNGIFAFALWDQNIRTLFLVRDPIGVKPLVYATAGGRVAFASEAKAVLASGIRGAELDHASLHLTMNVRYVPGTRTMFRGIQRLAPGHVLEVRHGYCESRAYAGIDWSPDESRSDGEWLEGIREHYQGAVRHQLLSDVPVGVSLSGGIDSSSIVAMLRQVGTDDIRTFSLGFGEPSDEVHDARRVAERFETHHHEIILDEPVLDQMVRAIWHAEEPKVNALQLYVLHRFIGGHVKVVLSGLGGDELFAGYDIHRYLNQSDRLTTKARPLVAAAGPALDAMARQLGALARPNLDLAVRGLEWAAAIDDPVRHWLLLRNAWDFNAALVDRVYTPAFAEHLATTSREAFEDAFDGLGPTQGQALRAEFATKMVNDLLHNEDTMSMAHSVESRVPLLDLELVRFVARIPDRVRFGRGPKGLLKAAMRDILPDFVLEKQKWGFTFDPVEQWKKDLHDLATEVLTPARIHDGGIFRYEFVDSILKARPRQRLRWHYFMLWQMIGVELWRDAFTPQWAEGMPVSPGNRQANGGGGSG